MPNKQLMPMDLYLGQELPFTTPTAVEKACDGAAECVECWPEDGMEQLHTRPLKTKQLGEIIIYYL